MVRVRNLDTIKAVALLAVVATHAPEAAAKHEAFWLWLTVLFRFFIPLFFIITGFFFMRSWRPESGGVAVFRRYLLRLGATFLFWALFYAVMPPFAEGETGTTGSRIQHHLVDIVLHPFFFLLTGRVFHLWFLSAMACGLVVLWLSLRYFSLHLALGVGAVFYFYALLGGPYAPALGWFNRFDWKLGPLISTLCLAAGAWMATWKALPPLRGVLALLLGGMLLYLAESYYLYQVSGREMGTHDYLIGSVPYAMGVLLLALKFPNVGYSRFLSRVSCYTLGIYAVHPYLYSLIAHSPWAEWIIPHAVLLFFGVFLLSYFVARGLAFFRPLRLVT